jgi:hypothetical protein
LKENTGNITESLKKFSPEQIKFIKETYADRLYYFGYSNHPTEENETKVIDFDDHTDYNLNYFNQFKKINAQMLEKVLVLAKTRLTEKTKEP